MGQQLELPSGIEEYCDVFTASGFVPTKGRAIDGPAIDEAPLFRELGCKCGHAFATHTYHGTGCWAELSAPFEATEARDFCDCVAFEVP